MAKHIKIPAPKKAKPKAKKRSKAKPKPEHRASLMDQAGELLQESIDSARAILEGIKQATESGETSPALAREAAALNRSIKDISAEIRQREKHIHSSVKTKSVEEIHMLVAEYLREIDFDGRKIFREIIIELDGKRSLLS